MTRFRSVLALIALATAFTLVAADADARLKAGGSRGTRTYSAPPVTRTAPNTAQPIQRTITQPGTPSVAGQAAGAATAARPGLFGGGLLGGLAAGFIGAGLFGMLFGHGFMGGMGGFASLLGLIVQIVLIVIVARLVIGWFQRRSQPAFAGATGASPQGAAPHGMERGMLGGLFGGGSSAPQGEPITIGKADYDAFEQLLGDIQTAYSSEDLSALRAKATPEMVSYFAEDLTGNASRGVVNRMSGIKLLQGDLSEAWREESSDYATVAMRYSLVDTYVERASGRIVEGSDTPQEVTELWTFVRSRGGHWLLSAIQET